MPYYAIAAFVLVAIVMAVGIVMTAKRNNAIKRSGIETDAVVTRIQESESIDAEGDVTITRTFYVTYRTLDGRTVESRLASGKSVDVRIGKKVWDRDLHEGSAVHIRYLPEKPEYVIRV